MRPAHVSVDARGAQVTARLDLDNGSSQGSSTDLSITSSDPSVIAVVDRRYVRGIAPGTATLTASEQGLTATISLTVGP